VEDQPITGNEGLHRVKVGCCGFARGMKDYFSQFRLVEVTIKNKQKWVERGSEFKQRFQPCFV